jgi:16S rRNA (adenine1518-N6/adenine1519-N6)-dimethyltransferase
VRESVLHRLAQAACGEHVSRVVEIGPGVGALTRHLLKRTDELHAVELDSSLADLLRRKLGSDPKLHVHEGDVLKTDLSQWGPAVIAGNLPYYITSPIIEQFLQMDERFQRAVFLMQWEVSQRILAPHGSRAYGYLSVATRLVCDVELVEKVPPSAFHPPPQVTSGALLFTRRPSQVEDLANVRRFAGWCFSQKRKTLRNNLRPHFGAIVDTLPEAGLRAEQLSPTEILDLYRRLSKSSLEQTLQ